MKKYILLVLLTFSTFAASLSMERKSKTNAIEKRKSKLNSASLHNVSIQKNIPVRTPYVHYNNPSPYNVPFSPLPYNGSIDDSDSSSSSFAFTPLNAESPRPLTPQDYYSNTNNTSVELSINNNPSYPSSAYSSLVIPTSNELDAYTTRPSPFSSTNYHSSLSLTPLSLPTLTPNLIPPTPSPSIKGFGYMHLTPQFQGERYDQLTLEWIRMAVGKLFQVKMHTYALITNDHYSCVVFYSPYAGKQVYVCSLEDKQQINTERSHWEKYFNFYYYSTYEPTILQQAEITSFKNRNPQEMLHSLAKKEGVENMKEKIIFNQICFSSKDFGNIPASENSLYSHDNIRYHRSLLFHMIRFFLLNKEKSIDWTTISTNEIKNIMLWWNRGFEYSYFAKTFNCEWFQWLLLTFRNQEMAYNSNPLYFNPLYYKVSIINLSEYYNNFFLVLAKLNNENKARFIIIISNLPKEEMESSSLTFSVEDKQELEKVKTQLSPINNSIPYTLERSQLVKGFLEEFYLENYTKFNSINSMTTLSNTQRDLDQFLQSKMNI